MLQNFTVIPAWADARLTLVGLPGLNKFVCAFEAHDVPLTEKIGEYIEASAITNSTTSTMLSPRHELAALEGTGIAILA